MGPLCCQIGSSIRKRHPSTTPLSGYPNCCHCLIAGPDGRDQQSTGFPRRAYFRSSMKKVFFSFLLGLLVGAGGYWYYAEGKNRDFKQDLAHSTEAVEEKAKKAGAAIADATTNARTTAAVKA